MRGRPNRPVRAFLSRKTRNGFRLTGWNIVPRSNPTPTLHGMQSARSQAVFSHDLTVYLRNLECKRHFISG
jgi:hypothetical protein